MSKLKKWIPYICAALIIVLLLYFVPFPTRINLEVDGMQVKTSGELKKDVTITMEGWRLNYLFKTDELKLKLLEIDDTELISYPKPAFKIYSSPILSYEDTVSYTVLPIYSSQEHAILHCTLVFENNFRSFLLKDYDEFYYIYAKDDQLTPEDILEKFQSHLG